jgi:hypothetical protein
MGLYIHLVLQSIANSINKVESIIATQEMLRSAIDSVTVDQFLRILSPVNQEDHETTIPSLDCDQPKFYWVFRNKDFEQWRSASSQVLWLSGPPECSIHQVSSSIVNQSKELALTTEHCVLYFFCSAAVGGKSVVSIFTQTLLYQIIHSSPIDKKLIVRNFLHTLVESILEKEEALSRELARFEGSPEIVLERIFNASADRLWTALKAALSNDQGRELLIVVDGLDEVQHQKGEFSKRIREFVAYLLKRTSKVKALLTSRPQAEIEEALEGLPCIEYNKERRG